MRKTSFYNWAAFTGLAVLVLGPLLAPGYILTLDMGWGPHMGSVSPQDNGWLLQQALHGLIHILPSWVVQKIVLLTIFVLSGVGLQRLARRASPGWPSYVAGVLYVVNPFVYERFMAGQWLVMAGYALLPWVLGALLRLLDRPGPRRALALGAWAAALGVVSLHLVAMAALMAAAILIAHAWGRPAAQLRRPALWLAASGGLTLVLSAVWLAPLLLQRSPTAQVVAGFDEAQYQAFATSGGLVGAPLNVLSLQGFWGDARGLVPPASGTGPWFWLAFLLVAALVGFGLVRAIRLRDRLGLALAVSAAIAWVLAIGIAWPPSAAVTHWLVAHFPFYRGYREPEKWVAVMALAYAYLAAVGLKTLREYFTGFWRSAVTIAAALLPVIWVPLIIWGGAGQLTATHYPAAWYDLNHRLSALPASSSSSPDTLILPWHQYIYLDFAHRLVANPAQNFFDRPVIVSSDPELAGLTPDGNASLANSIQNNVINRRFFEHNAGTKLRALGVHFVVLLKVSDWSAYGWLDTQSDLVLLAETPEWQLFSTQGHP